MGETQHGAYSWTQQEPTLISSIRILLSEWRLVAFVVASAAVLSIIIALLLPPTYRAEAVLSRVESADFGQTGALMSSLGGLANLTGLDLGGVSGDNANAVAVLRSRFLVEEFIRRNDLLPVLFSEAYSDETAERPTLWYGVKHFRENIRGITEDRASGLITVSIEWKDPNVVATWANAFVALANEILRQRALETAQENISFLQDQISKTNIVELQQVMYNLIQTEMQTLMLANVHQEFAFSTIDPAVPPEIRYRPNRTLLVISGTMLGMLLAVTFVALRRMRSLDGAPESK